MSCGTGECGCGCGELLHIHVKPEEVPVPSQEPLDAVPSGLQEAAREG